MNKKEEGGEESVRGSVWVRSERARREQGGGRSYQHPKVLKNSFFVDK